MNVSNLFLVSALVGIILSIPGARWQKLQVLYCLTFVSLGLGALGIWSNIEPLQIALGIVTFWVVFSLVRAFRKKKIKSTAPRET